MKKCPFCAEEVQDAAVKCKHCGEFFDPQFRPSRDAALPWYFRAGTVIGALLCLQALALPLVWWHPLYSRRKKVVISLVVGVVSYILWASFLQALKTLGEYYQLMLF